jgi:hypothetical protein
MINRKIVVTFYMNVVVSIVVMYVSSAGPWFKTGKVLFFFFFFYLKKMLQIHHAQSFTATAMFF